MEKQEYLNIYRNESSHFFYRANHSLVLALINKCRDGNNLKVLDAGCGTGLLAKKLSRYGEVWGVDISRQAVKFSQKRRIKVQKASVTKLPFQNNFFDVVTSIDVLYHLKVEDDAKALKEFHRVLKSSGLLILRVPANKWLYSQHDKHVHTRHRYSPRELATKLKKAKFKIEKISYINSILFVPALLKIMAEKTQKTSSSSSISKINPFLNRVLLSFLLAENFLLKFVDLPFGIGLLAVARKV